MDGFDSPDVERLAFYSEIYGQLPINFGKQLHNLTNRPVVERIVKSKLLGAGLFVLRSVKENDDEDSSSLLFADVVCFLGQFVFADRADVVDLVAVDESGMAVGMV